MNTYAQIIEGPRTYFGFFNIQFQAGYMKVCVSQGLKRPLKWQVDLRQISGLTNDLYLGIKRLAFYVGKREYILFGTGTGVVEYLENNLVVRA